VLFKILLGIDLLTAIVIGGFFIVGVADGSVSSFNTQLWIGIWFAVAAIIAGGVALHRVTKTIFANLTLALLAVPTVLYVIFIGVFVFSGTSWI